MKSDLSRDTFRVAKHFKRVLIQQGRVQVDADWNEQGDIVTHRIEREAADVIGGCGGPLHDDGFHIVTALSQFNKEEKDRPANNVAIPAGFAAPDFLISAGRYYVDGILCQNPALTSYSKQPDLPAPPPISTAGTYIVYLDVWERLITAFDDPSIREVALGGPDTAARVKTVWQVKHLLATKPASCVTSDDFNTLKKEPDGTLSARTRQDAAGTNPCIVPSSAKYTGLENQLYRVEVHDGGAALDVTAPPAGVAVTRVSNTTNQVQFKAGTWKAGQSVEFVSVKAGSDPMNGSLATITAVNGGVLTLSVNVSALPLADMQLRPVPATYKWSRNNGIVVAAIEGIKDAEVTVHDLGPDAVLGFNEGQWVEVINDTLELNGQPGMLAQILKIDRALNLMTLSAAPQKPLLDGNGDLDKAAHPKVRGWDGVGAIKFHPAAAADHDLELENGVRIRFFAGAFRSGDYWTIPARTATADALSGNIEWPTDANGAPLAQPPFGIRHHYCKLAIMEWDAANKQFKLPLSDCRSLFPPITELTTLLYVGGDGQEAMPNQPIPQLLQAGVFNGRWPVAGAKVRFTTAPNGRLAKNIAGLAAGTTSFTATTGTDGLASCAWQLDPDLAKNSQQVEARLLDAAANPLDQLLNFNGNLSIASQVFYKTDDKCATLQNQDTVQKAIDKVSHLVSLFEISGNDQEVMPGATLDPLSVIAASICGPAGGQKVSFKVVKGTGSVSPADVTTKDDGLASTKWTLDPNTPRQQVDATLIDANAPSTTPPTVVSFYANLSTAAQVAFDPGDCATLKGQNTVQKAVDKLADLVSLYEVSGNNLTVPPAPGATLELKVLAASRCGPVSKQRVKFTPVGKSGVVAPADTATGADGTATVAWKLDPTEPVQFVDATLVDEAAPSIAAPTTVRFTVALSLALDRSITVQTVRAESDGQALLNDSLVPPSRLQKGITVVCSDTVNPSAFGVAPQPTSAFPPDNTEQKPTCFLTLDLPYPLGSDVEFWGTDTFGFQPVILASVVSVANNEIHWTPAASAVRFLVAMFQRLVKITDRVLAHFTVKGNFIWSKDPSLLLDGNSFGKDGPGNRVDIAFPSGDGRKGGDFEMWFWLASEQLIPPAINPTFDAAVTAPGRVSGKVTLGGAPLPGVTITLSNPALGVRTTTTTSTGDFAFVNVPPGVWTATAQVQGAPLLQKAVSVPGGVNPG
ncbi:MAG TPA: DUF6519 domain-containing protein [Thermoanaerobaculia bacterium]